MEPLGVLRNLVNPVDTIREQNPNIENHPDLYIAELEQAVKKEREQRELIMLNSLEYLNNIQEKSEILTKQDKLLRQQKEEIDKEAVIKTNMQDVQNKLMQREADLTNQVCLLKQEIQEYKENRENEALPEASELEQEVLHLKAKLARRDTQLDEIKRQDARLNPREDMKFPEDRELIDKLLTGFQYFGDLLQRMNAKLDNACSDINKVSEPLTDYIEQIKSTLNTEAIKALSHYAQTGKNLLAELIEKGDLPQDIHTSRLYNLFDEMLIKWRPIQ